MIPSWIIVDFTARAEVRDLETVRFTNRHRTIRVVSISALQV